MGEGLSSLDNGQTLTTGNEITSTTTPVLIFSQFISTKIKALSVGDVAGMEITKIQGVPNLSVYNCWMLTPGTDGWVILFFDTPIYATDLQVYFQFSPGSTYLIQSTPYDAQMNYATVDKNTNLKWNNIWSKSLDPSLWDSYCDGTSECKRNIRYSLFPQTYKTNAIRIYVSIPDLSYMSHICGKKRSIKSLM